MKLKTLLAMSTLTAAGLALPVTTAAQEDPTAAGGGKKPFVLVVMDSSASMEWTDDGDDEYPMIDTDYDGTPDLWVTGGDEVFEPGDPMEIDEANPAAGVTGFGPCVMWEPTDDSDCNGDRADTEYHRPAWKPKTPGGWGMANPTDRWQDWSPNGGGRPIETRFWSLMRGTSGVNGVTRFRLTPQNQPRHVTIKEVMTGDMVLLPFDRASGDSVLNYDPDTFGPGCWFVPRQRDATAQQDPEDRLYCNGEDEFEDFPDHDQPLPHFQEVYDGQIGNGVMDKLSGSAIFAFAAFDGYRTEVRDPEFNAHWHPDHIDDKLDGSAPSSETAGIRDGGGAEGDNDCNGTGEKCYNLGLWRIVTPKDIEIPSTLLPEVSSFTQIALKDVGFLTRDEDKDFELDPEKKKSEERDYLGATFSKDLKDYIKKYQLGRHPIARATPLAAVMHDAYQFFSHGQDGDDPINDDSFAECRPKHVILLTDGKPEPERGDPTTLNAAFGYDIDRYAYDTTEQEIHYMVDDIDNSVPPTGSGYDPDFGVRVHVVGLNIGAGDSDAIEKLTRMAIEGKTCAEVLAPSLVPDTAGGPCDTSDPTTGCLVDQSAYVSAYTSDYNYVEPVSGDSADCDRFPALILDNNESDVLSAALFEMFSSVIQSAGLASRTKAVVTNELDNTSIQSGGQYRIFSGVKTGGSPWWKGVINRVTRRCDGTNDPAISFDDEVAQQVEIDSSGDVFDSRRVFTSVPHDIIYNYANYEPEGLGDQYSIPNDLFPMVYTLGRSDRDEFQQTYLFGSADPYLTTRVPFEDTALEEAYENPVTSPQNREHWEFFNVGSGGEIPNMVNVFRGRIPERASAAQGGTAAEGRAIGGILNSNPTLVGPPNLDLPIGSYREYRSQYANRPTMLYVASMDGLLHAMHTGRLDDRIRMRGMTAEDTVPGADAVGDATFEDGDQGQREAWAYLPQMLHREIAANLVSQPYLMDGSPVVKDVRLCDQDPNKNTSPQACPCPSGGCGSSYPAAQQWRSVLVEGRGLAGSGYFAMDVTRPGGLVTKNSGPFVVKNPDPVPLWEFDREWEKAQVNYLMDQSEEERVAELGIDSSVVGSCSDEDEFWRQPLMGLSVSEPTIGTVLINHPEGGKAQRPVVVFGAGTKRSDVTGCGANANGMAIYVIDLQTGSLLRRFVSYEYDGNTEYFADPHQVDAGNDPGPATVSGSAALFDGSTGAISTRAFIGDGAGRMFRIDMLDPDPVNWEVDLFFDPNDEGVNSDLAGLYSSAGFNNEEYGPADYKPAVTVSPSREVHVVYGLGEVGDTVTNDQVQAVLAVKETIGQDTGDLLWAQIFEEGEKLTGSPVIFDAVAYFPTYRLPNADVCEPGTARIWGLRVPDPESGNLVTYGVFQNNAQISSSPMGINVGPNDPTEGIKYFGPEDPTLIRGLTITLGESCSVDNIGEDNPTFNPNDKPKPQLIAQTSGDVDAAIKNTDNPGANAANTVDRLVVDIPDPESETIPLNWSIISN